MSSILMAGCYDFFLIKWIASVLGLIMTGLYKLFDMFTDKWIIGLCIIVFTIVCKMLLYPITLKQQKFTKVSSVMNPELQAIQKKYQGKTDTASRMKMQEETQALYEKYGTSPTGSCLPLLIQMPILFGLYAVIVSIPTYVEPVSQVYKNMSTPIVESIEVYEDINSLNNLLLSKDDDFDKMIENEDLDKIYENLIAMNSQVKPLEDFNLGYDKSMEIIPKLEKLSEKEWEEVAKKEDLSKEDKALLEKYAAYSNSDWDKLIDVLKENKEGKNGVDVYENEISDIYSFAGIDLSKSPKDNDWFALIIPILSFLTQWLSMKISQKNQPKMENNPMNSSMKAMLFTMPLISAFFCYTFAAGLGLYWVIAAVVQIVQQLIINKHFENKDVNDIIKENLEKQKKKRERMGIESNSRQISNAANMNVKNIKYENSSDTSVEGSSSNTDVTTVKPKKGSIAARANMVKDFNEKNKK